jgi:uncharacterized membrane protein YcjF (UPF0283 family)
MVARDPSWGREASALRTQHCDDFKQSLKDIAEGIARHEPSEKVLERHVTEAFVLLAIAGNDRRPWWSRHEIEIAAGGTLVGASASVPEWIKAFYPVDSEWRQAIIYAMTLIAIAIGVFLVVHGSLRIRRAIAWTMFGWRKRKTNQ